MKTSARLTCLLMLTGSLCIAQAPGQQKDKAAKEKQEQAPPAGKGKPEKKGKENANQHGQQTKDINQDFQTKMKAIQDDPSLTNEQKKAKKDALQKEHNEAISAQQAGKNTSGNELNKDKAADKSKDNKGGTAEKAEPGSKGKGKGKG